VSDQRIAKQLVVSETAQTQYIEIGQAEHAREDDCSRTARRCAHEGPDSDRFRGEPTKYSRVEGRRKAYQRRGGLEGLPAATQRYGQQRCHPIPAVADIHVVSFSRLTRRSQLRIFSSKSGGLVAVRNTPIEPMQLSNRVLLRESQWSSFFIVTALPALAGRLHSLRNDCYGHSRRPVSSLP